MKDSSGECLSKVLNYYSKKLKKRVNTKVGLNKYFFFFWKHFDDMTLKFVTPEDLVWLIGWLLFLLFFLLTNEFIIVVLNLEVLVLLHQE